MRDPLNKIKPLQGFTSTSMLKALKNSKYRCSIRLYIDELDAKRFLKEYILVEIVPVKRKSKAKG